MFPAVREHFKAAVQWLNKWCKRQGIIDAINALCPLTVVLTLPRYCFAPMFLSGVANVCGSASVGVLARHPVCMYLAKCCLPDAWVNRAGLSTNAYQTAVFDVPHMPGVFALAANVAGDSMCASIESRAGSPHCLGVLRHVLVWTICMFQCTAVLFMKSGQCMTRSQM